MTPATPSAPDRRRRSDGERTRAAILREAARMATVDGLDGLSLSHLAAAVGVSKSGLFAHFGSKEELQLETVAAASEVFDELVIQRATSAEPGLPRLRAFVDGFLDHVEEVVFPGGCFFVSAIGELGAHPGPVRDSALAFSGHWVGLLREQLEVAQAAGELDAAADALQLAFELQAFMVLGNMQFVASGEPGVLVFVHRAVDDRLAAVGGRHEPKHSAPRPT